MIVPNFGGLTPFLCVWPQDPTSGLAVSVSFVLKGGHSRLRGMSTFTGLQCWDLQVWGDVLKQYPPKSFRKNWAFLQNIKLSLIWALKGWALDFPVDENIFAVLKVRGYWKPLAAMTSGGNGYKPAHGAIVGWQVLLSSVMVLQNHLEMWEVHCVTAQIRNTLSSP